jgi:hypothetical protein
MKSYPGNDMGMDQTWDGHRLTHCVRSIGGAANAYIPTPEEEEHEKKIQEQEVELMRVRTQSKDRVKEIEHERQELRKESPSA